MLHLFVVILSVVLKDVQVGGQVVQLDLTEALKTHKSEEKDTVSNAQQWWINFINGCANCHNCTKSAGEPTQINHGP